jgi:hypothetical protein
MRDLDNRLKDPNIISEAEIILFFESMSNFNESNEIIEMDPHTHVYTSTNKGHPDWVKQRLDIASKMGSCALCGKNPCGDRTTMALVTIRPVGNVEFIRGICEDCKSSTIGQSKMKIYYRSFIALWRGIYNQHIMIEGGSIFSMTQGLYP